MSEGLVREVPVLAVDEASADVDGQEVGWVEDVEEVLEGTKVFTSLVIVESHEDKTREGPVLCAQLGNKEETNE